MNDLTSSLIAVIDNKATSFTCHFADIPVYLKDEFLEVELLGQR